MKKLIIPFLVLLLTIGIVACNGGEEVDPTPPRPEVGMDINADLSADFRQAMGNTSNINPLMATDGSAGDVRDLISGSLFRTGFDWPSAIAAGIADEVGDFSRIVATGQTADGVNTFSIEALGFTRFLDDAVAFPRAMLNEDVQDNPTLCVDGVLDQDLSRSTLDRLWQVELRRDLVWVNGAGEVVRGINAHDFIFTIQQYINPLLNNARANFITQAQYLNLVNAQQYMDGIAEFEHVGITLIDDYTLQFQLARPQTQWVFMGNLGLIDLVHRESFLAGMNEDGTMTDFGSIDRIPYSYGRFVLSNWEVDTQFTFTRNEHHHDAAFTNFARIIGFIEDAQTVIVNEFEQGNLDIAGVGGAFWSRFSDDPRVRLNPNSTFFRFDISLETPEGSDLVRSPLVHIPEFRQALFMAIDRQTLATDIIGPSLGNIAFASSIGKVTDVAPTFWNQSTQFRTTYADRGFNVDTYGFDPVGAAELFDKAYQILVDTEVIVDGDVIQLTFTLFDAESNVRIADFLEAGLEGIFGERFDLVQERLPLELFNARRNSGDFDILWNGLSGAPNDVVFLLHFVFLEAAFMSGLGWGYLADLPVTADLRYISDIIRAAHAAGEDLLDGDEAFMAAVPASGIFEGSGWDLIAIFEETVRFLSEYDGRTDDLHEIAAAFTGILLDEMPAIPVTSGVGAIIFQDNVALMLPAWHTIMGWGGLRYRYIKAPA